MRRRTFVFISAFCLFLTASVGWGQTLHTLATLNSPNPLSPYTGLAIDSNGNLYGSAYNPGQDNGSMFELVNSGGTYTVKTIYQWLSGIGTGYPMQGLGGTPIRDANGFLYGTLPMYGPMANSAGTIFRLSPNGVMTVLYAFNGGADGGNPDAGLVVGPDGNYYGTAGGGGNTDCTYFGQPNPCGVVFELVKGARTWAYKALYSFQSTGNDGFMPLGPLSFDSAGNIYGTTSAGGIRTGDGDCSYTGCGTVFKLTKNGSGQWTESILYYFTGNTDGERPEGGVTLDASGNIYGGTPHGDQGYGNLFQLVPNGTGGYTENTIITYNRTNGSMPNVAAQGNNFLVDASGNFWGTTYYGGAHGYGTIFKLVPGASPTYTDVYDFQGASDGQIPAGSLTADAAGNIYGVTAGEPSWGVSGTVFKLTFNGSRLKQATK
jgi:uncharacterized repeat protein (TIGR03803 family)